MFGACIWMSLKMSMEKDMSNKARKLIGRMCDSRFKYFDPKSRRYKFKLRPILIIGAEKELLPCDLTVLPVSKVSNVNNRDENYDYPLTKKKHSNLNLKYDPSYVRTHKVSTIHSKDLSFEYTDCSLADLYQEDYENIEKTYRTFSDNLFK